MHKNSYENEWRLLLLFVNEYKQYIFQEMQENLASAGQASEKGLYEKT